MTRFHSFTGATLDSRKVAPGMLFVAIKGEKVDGHDFIPMALAKGAAGVIDGREELAEAAREYLREMDPVVIGVTGSAGKTTVKELTAAFLRAGGYSVHATEGNFNNDLGLPLTILNCPRKVDFLVLEMGTNHPGEIQYLVDIAPPQVGLVSSIGTAHIEFFGDQDGIAQEKGALLRALGSASANERVRRQSDRSFAVLGANNVRHDMLAAMCPAAVETVSFDDHPLVDRMEEALRVRLPGRHNLMNALIAFRCASRFGVPFEKVVDALAGFSLPGGRWRVIERGGATYIDDTYNANPDSMVAALATFAEIPAARHVAVLGDMFELGERSREYHAMVARKARELGLDELVAVGSMSTAAMAADAAFPDAEAAGKALAGIVRPGDLVLLKASHGMHLDSVLNVNPSQAAS